jgi:glycosyltransferase involved in cell wall biosynthesis
MMRPPRVSVVVPAFNDEAFLATSLDSLGRQTLVDFEVIVSDDASVDGSRAIASEFVRRDSRFRLFVNPVNLGMTRNWNRALREAKGTYVVKLDADDSFRDETLAHLVAAMDGRQRPVAAYCRTVSCNAELEPLAPYLGEQALLRAQIDPQQAHCRAGHEWYRLSFDDFQIWHSNAQIHRRSVLMEMGGWDECWGCAADTDLILRVLERDEAVCHVPYLGALYRHREGSVSDQYRRQAWLAWESALLHLNSLHRYDLAGGRRTTVLRQAWWRYWQNWNTARRQGASALETLRPDSRERLMEQARQICPPPWAVRIEGYARQSLWRLKHSPLLRPKQPRRTP